MYFICYGLGKFAVSNSHSRNLSRGRNFKPVVLIFEVGFIGNGICEIVVFNVKDRGDTIETRIERRLW